ncbi:MAG TPA: glycosyltransferase family protein [Kofleriaceae bacterium]|nr:glycosyltransferase family protein [Kofleriaceae bacterium]
MKPEKTEILPRTVAIVQARMGSSRLPGKVLAALGGATVLEHVVRRLRAAEQVSEVVVATSTAADDDPIVREADRIGVWAYRGSLHDVLARYLGAARSYRADVVVRITADCPLIDPGVVDQVIGALGRDHDYASNTHTRRYPRGLDVEALHRDTLERIARLGRSAAAREHVTAYIMEQPQLFRVAQVAPAGDRDDSDLRWTVDTPDDLTLVRALYDELALAGADRVPPYTDVVAAVRADPRLATLNAHIAQKPWQDPHVA